MLTIPGRKLGQRRPNASTTGCSSSGCRRGVFLGPGTQPYPRPMTVAELGRELGIDTGDIEVIIASLGERVDDELTAMQAADLPDVLDAKVRLRR